MARSANVPSGQLSAADQAVETKILNEWRGKQGLPELKGARARMEKDRMKAAGQWPPGTTYSNKSSSRRSRSSTPPPATSAPMAPAAAGSARQQAGAAAAAAAAAVGGVAGRMSAVGATAPQQAPDPNDPVTRRLRTTALLVQPTWEIDGKWFRCWLPENPKQKVQLPREPKPGPYTPTEEIHPVLGMPQMLYTICVGIAEGIHTLTEGPTGVAKTTAYRWIAQSCNYNILTAQMHKDIAAENLVGEYRPTKSKSDQLLLEWMYAIVAKAVLASQEHRTILVFEELNRVGNLQVFAAIYSLLDDTRKLTIDDKRDEKGLVEELRPGHLFIGATQNPVDDDAADYIGVQELDPALRRRFGLQEIVGYPPADIEAEALRRRVKGLDADDAKKMVAAANEVRKAEKVRYPFSFPDMVAWAIGLPYYGWREAAERAVVAKAHPDYRVAIRRVIELQPTGVSR